MKRILFIALLCIPTINFSQHSVKPFLQDIVSLFPNVRDVAISPKGDEIMFSAQSVMGNVSTIITVIKKGSGWSSPEVASFSGQFFDLEPFFSKDGLKLYFVSSRPIDSFFNDSENFDIWYVERRTLNDNWSEPVNLGNPINTEYGEFYPSIADNGNLYFTRDNTTLNRKDDIYISEYKDGQYTNPYALSDAINSDGYEYNAFIAPDESYLLYGSYNRKNGFGSGDLYISYNSENNWTEAKNLGNAVNTDKMDYCPFVFKNVLYFTSKTDHTRTQYEHPLNIEELLKEFKRYDNGSSRLYYTPIENVLDKH